MKFLSGAHYSLNFTCTYLPQVSDNPLFSCSSPPPSALNIVKTSHTKTGYYNVAPKVSLPVSLNSAERPMAEEWRVAETFRLAVLLRKIRYGIGRKHWPNPREKRLHEQRMVSILPQDLFSFGQSYPHCCFPHFRTDVLEPMQTSPENCCLPAVLQTCSVLPK